MTPNARRLLLVIPPEGPRTLNRAAFDAGLATGTARYAARELAALQLARTTPRPEALLLELTDAGRDAQTDARVEDVL